MAVGIPIAVMTMTTPRNLRRLSAYIDATPGVAVVQSLHSAAAAQQAIETTDVMAVVEIPENFQPIYWLAKPRALLLNVGIVWHAFRYDTKSGTDSSCTFRRGRDAGRVAIGEDVTLTKTSYAPIQSQSVALFNTANNYQQFWRSLWYQPYYIFCRW